MILPSRVQFRRTLDAVASGNTDVLTRLQAILIAFMLVVGVVAVGGIQITIGRVGERAGGEATLSADGTYLPGQSAPIGSGTGATRATPGAGGTAVSNASSSPSGARPGGSGAPAAPRSGPVAAAPGPDGAPPPGAAPDAPPAGPVTLTASDRGVSEDTIRLGFVMMAGSSQDDDYDPEGGTPGRYTKIARTWANEINANGGVHGRQIEIVADSASIGSGGTDDMIRSCKHLVKDEKVFAVVASLGFEADAPQMCVAKENETPLITVDPLPAGRYPEAQPYLWCLCMNRDRVFAHWAAWLVDSGYVDPLTSVVGLIYEGLPYNAPSVENTLIPALEANGIKPVETVRLAADFEQGAAQLNNAVLQFRRANVTTVLPVMNLIYMANFMQAAEGQAYYPQYSATDLLFGTSDFAPNWITPWPGDSFNLARAITWTNSGMGPSGQMGVFGDFWGADFATYADGVYQRWNECAEGIYACDQPEDPADAALTFGADLQRTQNYLVGSKLLLFAEAATRAGPDLTRARWAEAMGSVTTWDKSAAAPLFTFGPNKWDGADLMAEVQWFRDAENGYDARRWHQVSGHVPRRS